LPKKYVKELLSFGAVYSSHNNTKLKTKTKVSSKDDVTSTAKRVIIETAKDYFGLIPAGTYVRVHVNPRLYPFASTLRSSDWISRIVYEDDNIICLNKPAKLPICSTVDNNVENVLYQLERSIHFLRNSSRIALHNTGRLDVCTSGEKTKKRSFFLFPLQ
jgi:23S rRNA-/tRNA-specific pseudouridylate synthase